MKYLSILFLLLTVSFIYPEENYYDTVNTRKEFFNDKTLNWEALKDFKKIVNDNGNATGVYFSRWKEGWDIMFFPAYKGENNYKTYGRIVYRYSLDRELQLVKVYFLENNDSYILFRRNPSKSFDIYLLGKLFRAEIGYNFDIEKLQYLPLYSIFSVLEENNLAKEIFINNNDADIKEDFIKKVVTPSFSNYSEDGAINEFGEYVSINTLALLPDNKRGLNCSGFIKEVTDTYMKLLDPKHKRIKIDVLKNRNIDSANHSRTQQAAYEFTSDPYFGKDWMENLTAEFNKNTAGLSAKAHEIKNDPYSSYFENRGFLLEDLSYILFRDQLADPWYVYVVVFNKYQANNTLVPTFYHMALMVPYMKGKHFYIRVFESGTETSFNQVIRNHLPSYFDRTTFTTYLLENRIKNEDDKELIEKSYTAGRDKNYYLSKNINDEDAVKLSKLFSRLEFHEEKITIYKFPLSYHFITSKNERSSR